MANMQKIGSHKTTVRTENNNRIVRYHNTDVVTFNDKFIYLNNGGFMTNTTKVRINQTANEYGLGFKLYQRNYTWFVEIFSDDLYPVTLKFDSDDIGFYNPNYMNYSEFSAILTSNFNYGTAMFSFTSSSPLIFQSELIENNTKLGNKLNPKDFLALLKA